MDYPGDSIVVDGVTYLLPADLPALQTIVENAKANNEIICLRGAAHSFPLIKTLEKGAASGRAYTYVMLSKLNQVKIDTTPSANAPYGTVWAQAGCHLGIDPWDPTGISTLENSLLYQMDQAGVAFNDLGGITHQTIGGFLSTSSSGGSTQFSFDNSLLSIDIMHYGANGAEIKTFTRPADNNPDDPFFGLGVASIGLFGIIVSATFICSKQFYILGSETTAKVEDCEIDLFGNGTPTKPSFQTFLEQKQTPESTDIYPYSRMMWWPQAGIQKTVLWKAMQTDLAGAEAWAKKGYSAMKKPPAEPWPSLKLYEEVPWIDGSPTLATIGADIMFSAIGNWPNWLLDSLGDTLEYKAIKDTVEATFYPKIFPWILNNIFMTDGIQYFSDNGWSGLPMDNQMSDKLFPVWFTELWIPIDQAQNVMNTMQTYYNGGCPATGFFSVEIYAAPSSTFWLSPAYGTDVIRIDLFWFGNNAGDPAEFYQNFWSLLAPYNFRPHWGKYLPDPAGAQGIAYLKSLYPKWDNWMALRAEMDPYNLFLNDYWSAHLGIPNT